MFAARKTSLPSIGTTKGKKKKDKTEKKRPSTPRGSSEKFNVFSNTESISIDLNMQDKLQILDDPEFGQKTLTKYFRFQMAKAIFDGVYVIPATEVPTIPDIKLKIQFAQQRKRIFDKQTNGGLLSYATGLAINNVVDIFSTLNRALVSANSLINIDLLLQANPKVIAKHIISLRVITLADCILQGTLNAGHSDDELHKIMLKFVGVVASHSASFDAEFKIKEFNTLISHMHEDMQMEAKNLLEQVEHSYIALRNLKSEPAIQLNDMMKVTEKYRQDIWATYCQQSNSDKQNQTALSARPIVAANLDLADSPVTLHVPALFSEAYHNKMVRVRKTNVDAKLKLYFQQWKTLNADFKNIRVICHFAFEFSKRLFLSLESAENISVETVIQGTRIG